MQHCTGYNWYSTNSLRRYNHQIAPQPSPQPQPEPGVEKIHQFSDEGRVQLGKASDPEAVEMQKRILNAVDEETLQKWDNFRQDTQQKSLLVRRRLGLPVDEIDEKYRNYPVKVQEQAIEQFVPDRSKYVFIRPVNPQPSTSSDVSPGHNDDLDDVFLDDRAAPYSPSRRIILSDKAAQSSSSSIMEHFKQRPLLKPATSSTITTPSSSQTSIVAPECTLFRYGHCPNQEICGRAHNGEVTFNEKQLKMSVPNVIWQRKLPTIPMCPGYTTMMCWDTNCKLRHAIYPSDLM